MLPQKPTPDTNGSEVETTKTNSKELIAGITSEEICTECGESETNKIKIRTVGLALMPSTLKCTHS